MCETELTKQSQFSLHDVDVLASRRSVSYLRLCLRFQRLGSAVPGDPNPDLLVLAVVVFACLPTRCPAFSLFTLYLLRSPLWRCSSSALQARKTKGNKKGNKKGKRNTSYSNNGNKITSTWYTLLLIVI